LSIVSGTDRPGSNALRVSEYLKRKYEQKGVSAAVTDLQNFPLNQVKGGKYGRELPEVDRFVARVTQKDGIVIISPEYNGSFPGILKLFLDYFPYPGSMYKRPVALVGESEGSFGALRAIEQLQQVMGYYNAHV